MTTPDPPAAPPVTGVPRIDEALAGLELGADVDAHPARLAAALDVLQRALNSPADEQ
ncbi:MAG: hypothetical protein AAGC63_13290 [Propionicimonas sp.]|nr:hypothetical protein [Propionicimonas sp.]